MTQWSTSSAPHSWKLHFVASSGCFSDINRHGYMCLRPHTVNVMSGRYSQSNPPFRMPLLRPAPRNPDVQLVKERIYTVDTRSHAMTASSIQKIERLVAIGVDFQAPLFVVLVYIHPSKLAFIPWRVNLPDVQQRIAIITECQLLYIHSLWMHAAPWLPWTIVGLLMPNDFFGNMSPLMPWTWSPQPVLLLLRWWPIAASLILTSPSLISSV